MNNELPSAWGLFQYFMNFQKKSKNIRKFLKKHLTICKNQYILIILEAGSFFLCMKHPANALGGALSMRVKITLACSECKQRNYNTMRNKKNTPDRLELKKYCRFCKKHTTHKETK